MRRYQVVSSKYFAVLGISHQHAEISIREKFSLSEEKIKALIQEYKSNNGEGIFVLSTCNRTEIYVLTDDQSTVENLFVKYAEADLKLLTKYAYYHTNEDAIKHLLKVSVGMESQIPGDFQIIGQVKKAFKLSKALDGTNAFLERLVNTAAQCSKSVKNHTDFSSGATSTSYAAIEYIKSKIPAYVDNQFLLYGSGKIGQHVCENLIKLVPKEQITVLNRTHEKALALSEKYDVNAGAVQEISNHLKAADVILVSTGAEDYTITREMMKDFSGKCIIDLSMPRNVDPSINEMEEIDLLGLDELSEITNKAIAERANEMERVKEIITKHYDEFYEWLQQRKLVPTIAAIKERLVAIQEVEINKFKKENEEFNEAHIHSISSDIIQKFTNQLSNQLKSVPAENIDLVHHLFQIDSSNAQ